MKLIPTFVLLFLSFLVTSFTPNIAKKVQVTCSENDAQIFVDGQLQGSGSVLVQVRKDQPVTVQIKKTGFITDQFTITYGGGVTPPKSYFRTLVADEAYNASAVTDLANIDIDIKTTKTEDQAWKLLSEVITTYFDVLEVTDKSSGYMRTSWAIQSFNASTIRTRVIIKSSSDNGHPKYKIKIVSEIADKPNTSAKDDEKFKQWNRILKKYNDLVSELQTRLK